MIKINDYVLATKYSDGDSQDHWAIGFYAGQIEGYDPPRYDIKDINGESFRYNGFRKVKKISVSEGNHILNNIAKICGSEKSIWKILNELRKTHARNCDEDHHFKGWDSCTGEEL